MKLYQEYPDLVIVARELPMVNGEEPCLRVRQACYLPIIVLGNGGDISEMLELGADAYMMKPPGTYELVARVHSLLRRKTRYYSGNGNHELETGNNGANGGNGKDMMTSTELRLASCLILNRGKVLEYPRIIDEVWGGKKVSLDTLHYHMRRLRRKLQVYSPYPMEIRVLRGVGYFCTVDL
jgi:two-component system response regulator ArlR